MPTLTLAQRALRIRQAAGFGEDRQQAEFARKLGIKPPSLPTAALPPAAAAREKY